MSEQEMIEAEREEETEYLGTISNFHWFVYPFFKAVEMACDRVFGCKKKAVALNKQAWEQREQRQKEAEEEFLAHRKQQEEEAKEWDRQQA